MYLSVNAKVLGNTTGKLTAEIARVRCVSPPKSVGLGYAGRHHTTKIVGRIPLVDEVGFGIAE